VTGREKDYKGDVINEHVQVCQNMVRVALGLQLEAHDGRELFLQQPRQESIEVLQAEDEPLADFSEMVFKLGGLHTFGLARQAGSHLQGIENVVDAETELHPFLWRGHRAALVGRGKLAMQTVLDGHVYHPCLIAMNDSAALQEGQENEVACDEEPQEVRDSLRRRQLHTAMPAMPMPNSVIVEGSGAADTPELGWYRKP